jgi:hypothetical protein
MGIILPLRLLWLDYTAPSVWWCFAQHIECCDVPTISTLWMFGDFGTVGTWYRSYIINNSIGTHQGHSFLTMLNARRRYNFFGLASYCSLHVPTRPPSSNQCALNIKEAFIVPHCVPHLVFLSCPCTLMHPPSQILRQFVSWISYSRLFSFGLWRFGAFTFSVKGLNNSLPYSKLTHHANNKVGTIGHLHTPTVCVH